VTQPASRAIVHLSDLHFGRTDPAIVRALHDAVWALEPDIVAISGDLTQRARRGQFRRARHFIDGLPSPRLIVPGNHDVPLFNVVGRLMNPLGGYTRYVTEDLSPTLMDEIVWVTGINTTRPATWKDGGIDAATLERVEASVRAVPAGRVKMVVAHHPFDGPDGTGTAPALHILTGAGVDVFLTGHLHTSYTGHTAQRYKTGGRTAVVVEAATATSTRLRQEANGFNVLRVAAGSIDVEAHTWDGRRFASREVQSFRLGDGGWTALSENG
jgi:3',5'-cyclic AMP phosphodiesterase CpdA